jgi:signal transduction histidine kinase
MLRRVAASATVSRRPLGVPWMVPAVGVAAAAAAVVATRGSGVLVSSYAETSELALGADLAAGLAMMTAGVAIRLMSPAGPALVAVLIGGAWSASDWVGAEQAPAAVRSVAMVAVPFLPALVAHLGLAWPEGRLRGAARTAVALVYAVTAATVLGLAVLREPLFDRHCWQNCTDNVFLVRADVDAARMLATLSAWTTIGIALLLACAVLFCIGPRPRRGPGPVLLLAAGVAAAEGLYAAVRLAEPAGEPASAPFPALFLLRAGALLALAVALSGSAVATLRRRAALQRLAQELAATPAPGALRRTLAESLGDPQLRVAYWLDSPRCHVDADGQQVEADPAPGQVATAITRGGAVVAVVVHARGLSEQARVLQHVIGAAARLAIDNERLRAQALFRLRDVRASQRRIVASSDVARRALERDLHDGAQQRLLGVSFQLHGALTGARAGGCDAEVPLLTEASAQALEALAAVRELAHGIFPAILTDAGLAPALRTFAAGAGLPVELVEVDEERYAAEVETAAYVAVTEAVADAARRSAGYAAVRVCRDRDRLDVVVTDDGDAADPAHLQHLVDRVEALGGRLAIGPGSLRAELPCA